MEIVPCLSSRGDPWPKTRLHNTSPSSVGQTVLLEQGRYPGSWIVAVCSRPSRTSRPVAQGWLPIHSGGTAPDLHRLPCTNRLVRTTGSPVPIRYPVCSIILEAPMTCLPFLHLYRIGQPEVGKGSHFAQDAGGRFHDRHRQHRSRAFAEPHLHQQERLEAHRLQYAGVRRFFRQM